MTSPGPGLRERKKAQLRYQLVEAALSTFVRRGYHETTIDDLVGSVDVSRRTFFRYFDSKESVLLAWIDDLSGEIVDGFAARPAREHPLDSLCHAYRDVLTRYESDRPRFLAIERLILGTPAIRAAKLERMSRLSGELTAVLCTRTGADHRRSLAPRVLVRAGAGVVDAAVEVWVQRDGRVRLGSLIEQGFAVLQGRRAR